MKFKIFLTFFIVLAFLFLGKVGLVQASVKQDFEIKNNFTNISQMFSEGRGGPHNGWPICTRHGDWKYCSGASYFNSTYYDRYTLDYFAFEGHRHGGSNVWLVMCLIPAGSGAEYQENDEGADCRWFGNATGSALGPEYGDTDTFHCYLRANTGDCDNPLGGVTFDTSGISMLNPNLGGGWGAHVFYRIALEDAEVRLNGRAYATAVNIDEFQPTGGTYNIGQNFDVYWRVSDKGAHRIEVEHSSNIDCDYDEGEFFWDDRAEGTNPCRGVSGSSGWLKMKAWGEAEIYTEQTYNIDFNTPAPGPFNLNVSSCYGNGFYDLDWSDSSNATSYDVYAHAWSNGSWQYRGNTVGHSWTTQESLGMDWYFKVIAINATGSTESTPNNLYAGNCPLNNYQLSVSKNGTGTGTVTSNPAGINCGGTCVANYTQGTTVTLTATPDAGSTFAGWSGGGCSGTGTCVVTMNANTSVTATFNLNTCAHAATFISQTINGITYNSSTTVNLSPNTSYPVVITMRNTCDDTWSTAADYHLGSQNPQDNFNWGFARVNQQQASVAKNQNATFSFNITTQASGTRNFQWRMVHDGVTWFGESTPNIIINATSCSYSINPTSQSFNSSGGSSSVTVTAGAGCAWNASESLTWASITSGASGTGNGTVNYTVDANTGTARNGTMTIAGQNFSISQSAPAASGVINFSITYTPKTLNSPTNVTVDNSVCGKITVNWSYTSNGVENGFTVYRSTDDTNWTAITPIPTASGYLTAAARSYQDTPPTTGDRYYYMVRTHRGIGSGPSESPNSNSDNAVNQSCLGNLSLSTKQLVRVNGAAFNPTTKIKQGDTLTYQITIVNSGPASVTINFICENPSSNLTNMTNLAVSGTGSSSSGITQSDATCISLGHSGKRLNVTGTKNIANNWLVTFDTTFTTTTPDDPQEPVDNSATIYYTDGSGQHPKTVVAPTVLVTTTKAQVPTFREVAP